MITFMIFSLDTYHQRHIQLQVFWCTPPTWNDGATEFLDSQAWCNPPYKFIKHTENYQCLQPPIWHIFVYIILKYTKEPPAIVWILSGFETKQLLFGRNLPDVIFTLVKFLMNPIWKLPLGILSMDEVDNILESDVCFFSVPKYKVACEVL